MTAERLTAIPVQGSPLSAAAAYTAILLMSSGTNGNARFIAQCVAWCTEADTAVSIPARSISDEPVSVTLGQIIILAALLILVLPVALLVQGISVYLKRRHS